MEYSAIHEKATSEQEKSPFSGRRIVRQDRRQVYYAARAKYIPQCDGSFKLAQVQAFNREVFRQEGWEPDRAEREPDELEELIEKCEIAAEDHQDNINRAIRRAKIHAFDTILCNQDLDTFATFTYRPEDALDKASYEACYDILKPWLSNRVQRNGLKYVIVPERHKSGDIHFHGIMNQGALKMIEARSPHTGRKLVRNGMPIYNITDWTAGFTTAQIIASGDDDRTKVAKYIFKYMGKQYESGAGDVKIGGRYALIGGKNMQKPLYIYGNSVEELVGSESATYTKVLNITKDMTYTEVSYL